MASKKKEIRYVGAPLGNKNAVKDGPKRDTPIALRVNKDELKKIDEAAALLKVSRNTFMVDAAFDKALEILEKKKKK